MSLKPNTRMKVRPNQYKVAVDAEEGRRRREDNMVVIRKIKRKESLMKKRFTCEALKKSELESLQDMVNGVWSDDPTLQLKSATQFRMLLSIEKKLSESTKRVIDSGVVPRFVEFLKKEDYPQIQFEAAWALTNIAAGSSDHTKVVIDNNAVPIFVHLVASSPSDDVREQAVWALGNLAANSPQYVLRSGALDPLLNQLNEHTNLSMLRNVAWAFSNLCRGQVIPTVLPALERLIHSTDEQVLTDACWAFSYLSNGTNDKIQTVIDSGVVPRLVQLLLHPSSTVLIPTLRTVGYIVTGDNLQSQCVINSGALPCLANLLSLNYEKNIKKEACWTVSNITAGTQEHIQMVIEANLVAPLVNLLQNAEFDIKKEAAWAISNATKGGSYNQIKYLVRQGCIKPLCDLLLSPDPKIIIVCLKGLKNILKVGEAEDINYYVMMIDDAEGLEKIENLQSHDNIEIYEKAGKILDRYLLEDED